MMFWLGYRLVMALLLVVVGKTTSHVASGPHVADVNILLPPKMTNPVEYRLQGSDGCFKWSWDHHDILSVLPEYNSSNHCSTSARLRSIAPYSGRKETAVYAADVYSGIVIRCKVFIDNFSRIQIFHNSIKLDLDGLATLRVRAFDTEDNVFSSLVGLRFMWQLMPETDGLTHHLVQVPLKDSPLSDCGGLCGDLDIQIELENSGVFSDLYVVKGIGIGHEKVSVHLLEPELMHMADNILLTVAEAMSLEPPSPVFVLVGALLQYTLKVIRGNTPQAISVVTLPSPHHRWSVSNPSFAQVDTMMGLTRALSLGETVVIVEDTRVAGHMQVSSLNVVLPDTLCLYISPLSIDGDPIEGTKAIPSVARWYVVSGYQYLIQMKVFSQGPGSEEIYITESDDVKVFDNQSKYWETFLVSDDIVLEHGWRNSKILKTTSQGPGNLTASLTYFSGNRDTKEVLKVVQEIMVCDQVKFGRDLKNGMSESIILPWAPGVYQEVDLKATGGCAKASSDYKWFSSDMAIVSVSATGVMQAKKPGKATVKVASIFDSFNFDEIVIEVSLPSSIVMLQNFPVETVVGSYLQAAVTMKASNGAYFYKCDAFSSSVNWKAGRESFIVVNATEKTPFLYKLGTVEHDSSFHGSPCSWTYIYASGSGRTMLHATLSKDYQNLDHSLDGPIVLKASSHIAAYPPFVVQQAGDGSQFGGYWYNKDQVEITTQVENLDKLHLVPGTRIDVLLVGGPERWDESIDFIETFEIFDEKHNHARNGVHVHVISGSYGSSYGVLCQTLGSFKLVFKHGNLIGDDHPLPAVAEVSLSLICSYPSSIVLLVDEPDNAHKVIRSAIQADRSPGRVRVTPVTVANGQTIRVAAAGVGSSGEPFANSSSLCLRWELSNCDGLAYWDDAYDSQRSKSSWERFLVMQNESGLCVVRATVAGFCDSKDGRHSAQLLEIAEDVLTDAIRIQLVSTLRVNPEYNLLFFNPAAKANLSIIGGSCFWEAAVNDSQVVEVILPPAGLQCLQLMLSPKGLGTALVTVYDIGLAPPRAASALVQVADVDWIKIVSGEEISLMEGRLQSIDLMAGIDDGSTFDSSQYAYMDIHVHIEDHIVELVDDDAISGPDDGYVSMSSFNIMAKHLGITTLYVSVLQRSGHEILSQLIKVEVYAPLSIHPPEIFLVPGASYMLALEGGPTIGVYVDYTSMNDGIAKVHRSGQLFAISPGNTTLLATVFGNGDVVICQAYSMVKVGVPSSVILNVQSEQLAVGREMPIHPLFPEGNLFSFYELCRSYNWTIEDEKVLSFGLEQLQCENQGLLSAVSGQPQFFNYLDERELGFIKVLHARSAGRTSVTTAFLCDFVSDSYSQSRIYSASVSLLVVPDLPLALGTLITWVLPPHYTTTALLPSSSDLHGPLDSQSRKGSIVYSLLRMCSEKNVAVNKEDISIDGDRIKTTSSNNLACIQAKDQSTGRIEIASCIRVTEVAQIRISNKEFPSSVIHLAVGAELEIPISYYDALGNPFYEAHNVIFYHVETNYHDIVSINHTLSGSGKVHLKAKRQGRALVQVAINRSRQKSDYILISVGAHIYPQNPLLYVGDGLNFSIEGFSDQVSGHWFSANESVVYVHKPFGKAEAVGIGSTQVFFKCPTMKLQTTVTVLSRNIISVDAPKEVLTNVPYPTKGYTFAVRFSDTHKKLKARENNAVSYDCEVDPPFIGYAKPWMDLNTGNLYCLFFPYSPEHLVRSVPKSRDTSPYISISINASLREAHHVSGSASASALFIGGFSILEMDKNSLQLDLTPESNKTTITILGNTGVEIHWHNRDCMKISPVHKEDFGTGGHVQYEVEVVVAKKFKDKIVVTLPANGQRVEVDVNFDTGQREASGSRVKGIASIIGFSALIALILVIIISKLDGVVERSTRSQLTVSPAAASMTTPGTPERSPAVPNEQVLRTPQPFVDYVRRTIDETPYYRRDARRRFNPQNTI